MNSTFTKKRISVTITLGEGTFGETVGDTVTLSGLRMTADLTGHTGETMATLQLRVFGLNQQMMNRLTIIGPFIGLSRPKDTILVMAGDDESGMATVFKGNILTAWADYASAPDVVLNLMGQVGVDIAMKPVPPRSYAGSTDVAAILEEIAKDAGLDFSNNGVSVKLSNPYFPGTAMAQIKSCVHAANINYEISLGRLSIWPRGGLASESEVELVSPSTGMVGYPTFSSRLMSVKMLFNSRIRQGGRLRVESSLHLAEGEFNTYNFTHSLSSEVPGGPWFTDIECIPYVKS